MSPLIPLPSHTTCSVWTKVNKKRADSFCKDYKWIWSPWIHKVTYFLRNITRDSIPYICWTEATKGLRSFFSQQEAFTFLSYFFVKKYLLVGASSMLWTGQRISESVSQRVRDVCMSHQSDRIYYKQPIMFLVLNVNGIWEDLIPIQFRTAIFSLL